MGKTVRFDSPDREWKKSFNLGKNKLTRKAQVRKLAAKEALRGRSR